MGTWIDYIESRSISKGNKIYRLKLGSFVIEIEFKDIYIKGK
jgi:hypothetical protein